VQGALPALPDRNPQHEENHEENEVSL